MYKNKCKGLSTQRFILSTSSKGVCIFFLNIYTTQHTLYIKYNTKYKNTHKRTSTYTSALNNMSVCHQIFLSLTE